MRIDAEEQRALDIALEDVTDDVYLFGSRVFDDKRGGDIDILIFSQKDPFSLAREVAVKFFMECEEKIDVVVMDPDRQDTNQRTFLNTLVLEPFKVSKHSGRHKAPKAQSKQCVQADRSE